MKIGFDCDDVLVESCEIYTFAYNQRYGTDYTAKEITPEPQRWKELPDGELLHKNMFDLLHEIGFDLPLVEGALFGVQELGQKGHELLVITNRITPYELTCGYLCRNFGPVFEKVIYCINHDKNLVRTKGEVAVAESLDLVVEDLEKNVYDLEQHGIMTLVYDRLWNQNIPEGKLIKRVHNWDELIKAIGQYDPKRKEFITGTRS